MKRAIAGVVSSILLVTAANAAPVTYNIDSDHTYPAFEADHMGGLSTWRGKVNSTTGKVVVDTAAKTGTVDVSMDMKSIDFGHDKMNTHTTSAGHARCRQVPDGHLQRQDRLQWCESFRGAGQPDPARRDQAGDAEDQQFLCKPHPMSKKEVCGADASGTFNREDFGVSYGKAMGFNMDVKLLISVEAVKAD